MKATKGQPPAGQAAKKAGAKRPAAGGASPPATSDVPFHSLSRDAASAFLYAALLPEEVLGLVRQLGLSVPGFRLEGLGEVERCDLLADELRAGGRAQEPVMAALRQALQEPAFAGSGLDVAAADELLEVAGSDHGLAIALWRLLVDPQAEVQARGASALERMAKEWFGPAPAAAGPAPDGEAPEPAAARDTGEGRVQALEERLNKATARAEAERERADSTRDKLQAQVKEARAEAARAVDDAARAREAAEAARAAQARSEAALAQARAGEASAEAARLRLGLREAEVRLHAAESQLARVGEREAAAQQALQALKAEQSEAAGAAAASVLPAEPAAEEVEEAPATWLLPVFTDEFYSSLAGWDRRIQRAALKQAFLLSQDHRHPSLRALPLEGLPGYYRVRVATDVRLIYRRGERQDTVEICSLIDREDLDRYVRQAKTR
jgi:mRNA-degrading endonuclease RelE of RelBE toxin-antitoxin system